MKPRSLPQKPRHPEAAIRRVATLCLVGLAAPVNGWAEDTNTSHRVALEYRQLGPEENLDWIALNVVSSSSRFRKEPDIGGRLVSRGLLSFGMSREEPIP